jgi:integrase
MVIKEDFARVKINRMSRPDGIPVYSVDYRQDGRRIRKAFTDLKKAVKLGECTAKRLARGDTLALKLTGHDVNCLVRGKQALESVGIPVDIAARNYAEACKILGGDFVLDAAKYYASRSGHKAKPVNVADLCQEFLEAKSQGLRTYLRQRKPKTVSKRYLVDLRQKLNVFSECFHCPVAGVTSEQIDAFLGRLESGGRTRNNFLAAINSLFSFAKFRNYLPKEHDVMDHVSAMAEDDFDIEIFTPAELRALLAAADAELLPVLTIQAFSGLRTAEVMRLDWSEVKPATIEVSARKSKTGARRLVTILPNLTTWLAPFRSRIGPVWPQSAPWLYERFADLAEAAGVAWKHNALRHSFVSYRVAATQNVNQVALEAGNSPQMIFEHYRELVTPEDASAWFAIAPKLPANVIPVAIAATARV